MEDPVNQEEQAPSEFDRLRQRVQDRNARVQDFRETRAQLESVKAAQEQGPGFWKESGKAVWGAAVDLSTELIMMSSDVVYSLPPVQGLHELAVGFDDDLQELPLAEYHEAKSERAAEQYEQFKKDFRAEGDKLAPANETFLGGASRGILQFMIPYTKLSAGQKVSMAGAAGRGFAIDYALFDPNEGNLSNLIEQLDPDMKDSALTFLATEPDDTEAEKRLKNAFEGLVLGTALEGIFKMARKVMGQKKIDEAHEAAETMQPKVVFKETDEATDKVVKEAVDPAPAKEADVPAEVDADKIAEELAPVSVTQTLRDTLTMSPKAAKEFNDKLLAGDEVGASAALDNGFNLDTINWDNVEDADSIKGIIDVTAEVLADHITDTHKGVQSHVQTARLGNLVGKSAESVHELFKDVSGHKGIAARMHAAQRIMLSSARRLNDLRKLAKAEPGNLEHRANFMRQVHLHGALQAQVKGAQTEIARALNAMKIMKEQAAEGFTEFDSIHRILKTDDPKNFDKYMDDLLDGKSLEEINEGIRKVTGSRLKDIWVEWTINAMLSSPKTHIINATSNLLNTALYPIDRVVGGMGRAVAGDMRGLREAKLDIVRKVSSLGEALKLARQAWKDGAPVSDKRQRLEFQTRKAISMSGEGWLATSVNVLGEVVRVPGRMLITGDEFFKAINRNSELTVQAYRKADELVQKKGLKPGTDKYEKALQKVMANLLDPKNTSKAARDIRQAAVDRSRLVSFQESPQTSMGGPMEKAISASTVVKMLIAPFFRTPMNILRQGLIDRTPLGVLMSKHRDVLANGSPAEKAELIARMTSGVAAMSVAMGTMGVDNESPIQIVGKVPWESSKRATGVRDYSMRIGDTWYQFNRLDPLGMWVGMVADAKMHMEHSDDEEATHAAMQAPLVAFLNNVTNKTWAKSLADLLDMIEGVSSNDQAATSRAIAKFQAGEFGKMIPQIFKSTGKSLLDGEEQFAREAWTFTDALNAQLPIFNKDVPVRHDALGRPVSWENSKWAIVNPFASSPDADNPLDKELFRLGFDLRPMRKAVAGGQLDLTGAEYSEMTGMVGKIPLGNHPDLESYLTEMVQSERYLEGNDAMRVFMLKKVINKVRQGAALQWAAKPENIERFKGVKFEAFAQLFSE